MIPPREILWPWLWLTQPPRDDWPAWFEWPRFAVGMTILGLGCLAVANFAIWCLVLILIDAWRWVVGLFA